MKSHNFKIVCLLKGTYFLDSLNKNNIQIKIKDITLNMVKNEKDIEINSIFKANSELEADSKFREAIEFLKCIIIFCTRRAPMLDSFNIYNTDELQGFSMINASVTIINSMELPNTGDILANIDTINQSVHLENAFHYYRLANLTDDNKEAILDLYKCVESIIGYPKGNDRHFKESLAKLDLDGFLDKFKNLRRLRNKFDAGHSAGGKEYGNRSHRDIEISNEEVEYGKDLIQRLIKSTIDYLSLGNFIADVFIPDE